MTRIARIIEPAPSACRSRPGLGRVQVLSFDAEDRWMRAYGMELEVLNFALHEVPLGSHVAITQCAEDGRSWITAVFDWIAPPQDDPDDEPTPG